MPEQNIFEMMGGEKGVEFFIGQLYLEILEDSELARFFTSSSIHSVMTHHRDLIVEILGGEKTYKGRDLWRAHQHLVQEHGLADKHVDLFKAKVAKALANCGYGQEVIDCMDKLLEERRDTVLNRRADST